MKKQTITIIVTTVITVVALFAALIYFMPTIGPRYLMPLMMGGEITSVPASLDTSTSLLSDQGLFRISYTSNETAVPLNQIHSWTLHLETADGKPVENAELSVGGGMPQHGHGLPTSPQVTEIHGGDYLVEGMKFQMLGWWEVRFNISVDGQSDTVTFNLILE